MTWAFVMRWTTVIAICADKLDGTPTLTGFDMIQDAGILSWCYLQQLRHDVG